jgi:hypothetical protein
MRARANWRWGVAALLLLSACRSGVRESKGNAPPAMAPAASPAPKLLLQLPPGAAGDWVEARHYRFRVLDAFPCDEAQTAEVLDSSECAPTELDPKPLSATTPGKPGHFRLGVAIEIEANDAVFATPKAVVLEKDGQVFFATMAPRPTAACRALLTPRALHSSERASGIVVFEAPDAGYLAGATLTFRPPRWGYESKARVVLPDCFGKDCPRPAQTAEARL